MSDELVVIDQDYESPSDELELRLNRIESQLSDFERTLKARVAQPGIENGEERMQILERRSDPKLLLERRRLIMGLRAHVDDLIERVEKLERAEAKRYTEAVRKQIEYNEAVRKQIESGERK